VVLSEKKKKGKEEGFPRLAGGKKKQKTVKGGEKWEKNIAQKKKRAVLTAQQNTCPQGGTLCAPLWRETRGGGGGGRAIRGEGRGKGSENRTKGEGKERE